MGVVVVANGELAPGPWIQRYLDEAKIVIAADGGAEHLQALGITPDAVIGDMDSVAEASLGVMQRAGVSVLAHPVLKDESDLELALRHAAENYEDDILLFGALGGRLDQLLANVLLLSAPFLCGRRVTIIEEHQSAWIMKEGAEHIRGRAGDLVSLIPLGGDVRIRRTDGLKWPIIGEALLQGMSRGISNRLTAETATVEIEEGTLLCVQLDAEWQR